MNFNELEKQVREFIGQNNYEASFKLLQASFMEDDDQNTLTLQIAKFHQLKAQELQGVISQQNMLLEMANVASGVLQFVQSKKEYDKYKSQTFGEAATRPSFSDEKIKVFFSVGSPHNDEQQKYINRIIEYFDEHGIALETLKGWDESDPLLPIIAELKQASGCLVLALERYYIKSGLAKRGSGQEAMINDVSFASPWLHIETAIARSLNLPLMILKDEALKNDGLIHNDKQEWGIVRIDQNNVNEVSDYPIKHFILNWIKQVKNYHQSD